MGIIALEAAYRYGSNWHEELIKYLESNLKYIREYLNKFIPKIKLIEPEGTYLIWLDCRGLNISDERLNYIILNKANLWLDSGNIFGNSGLCYERINLACPKAILEKALNNLYNALTEENLI